MRDRPSVETFVRSLFLSLPLFHYTWMNLCCTLETFAISLLVILRNFVDLNFNYQYIPSKHSSWWRRLEDVLRLHLQKTSSRRFDQDEYIGLTHTSSEDVLIKTNVFVLVIGLQDVLPRHLQNVFKTSSRHLQDVLLRPFQDVFKMFSRRLAKTSSRRFEDVFKISWRHLHDIKTYHWVKLFLLTCFQDSRSVMAIITAKLHSTKPELRFCTSSNPTILKHENENCRKMFKINFKN